MMPLSTSPLPPVASPGFPAATVARVPLAVATTDGTPLSSTGPNSSFVGAFACAGMAVSQTNADNGAFSLKLIQATATVESGYYEMSLRAVYMPLLTGNFVRTT